MNTPKIMFSPKRKILFPPRETFTREFDISGQCYGLGDLSIKEIIDHYNIGDNLENCFIKMESDGDDTFMVLYRQETCETPNYETLKKAYDEDNLRYEKEMVEYNKYLQKKQLDEDRKHYFILREKLGIKD